MKIKKKFFGIIAFIILFFAFSYLIFVKIPLAEYINSAGLYKLIIIPLISMFGSNVVSASFLYPILFFLKQNGMNTILLASLAAIGGTAGDILFVYFGKGINENIRNKNRRIFEFFEKNQNSPYIRLFIFLYPVLIPVSNEFMTLALGYIKYPAKKIVIPLLFGNIIYYTLLIGIGGKLIEIIF